MNTDSVDSIFNKIYDETYQKCLIYITCKCNNTSDIPDILQETYMQLYRVIKNKGVDYIDNYEAYIIKIAKSKLYNHYTIQEKIKAILPIFSKKDDGEEVNIIDLENSNLEKELEIDVVNKDTLDSIWSFLQTKSYEVQKVFYLFYYSDMAIPEIAKMLNINESTVKSRIYRTTNEIRQKFKGEGEY